MSTCTALDRICLTHVITAQQYLCIGFPRQSQDAWIVRALADGGTVPLAHLLVLISCVQRNCATIYDELDICTFNCPAGGKHLNRYLGYQLVWGQVTDASVLVPACVVESMHGVLGEGWPALTPKRPAQNPYQESLTGRLVGE